MINSYSHYLLLSLDLIVGEGKPKCFLSHLTEASIWVKNIILPEKKMHMTNFKIAMAIIFLLFLTEKWQSSVFFHIVSQQQYPRR